MTTEIENLREEIKQLLNIESEMNKKNITDILERIDVLILRIESCEAHANNIHEKLIKMRIMDKV